jgi:hypothetical protein
MIGLAMWQKPLGQCLKSKRTNKELPDFELVPLVPFQQAFHTKLRKLPRRFK